MFSLKGQTYITLIRLGKYCRVGIEEMQEPRASKNCSEVVSSRHSISIKFMNWEQSNLLLHDQSTPDQTVNIFNKNEGGVYDVLPLIE